MKIITRSAVQLDLNKSKQVKNEGTKRIKEKKTGKKEKQVH